MLRKLSKDAKITLSILLIFIGLILIFSGYFISIKEDVFNKKNIDLLETLVEISELPDEIEEEEEVITTTTEVVNERYNYIGYLSIPDINLRRGFVDINSKYNSVGYNVTQIKGSKLPNVKNGNLILAAHRGNSPVSYFDKLYKLKMGAKATITYQDKDYKYKLVDQYTVPKNGTINVVRNANATVLTLITCTRNDKKTQTVFIFELI